jgi:uncharacterized membrane protein YphA (DoxX/SURF4 family)
MGGFMIVNLLAIVLTVYLIYVFGNAGYKKLTNDPMLVGSFDAIGPVVGFTAEQFRKFTGTLEIISALFLLIPPLTSFGATILVGIMIGAIIVHVRVFKSGWQTPAGLLVSALILAILRW